MADASAPPPAIGVRRLEPQGGAVEADLSRVAALHRRCLPWTASSRAGSDVVEALYRAVLVDPAAVVLATHGGEAGGGFASGTLDLRRTEVRLRARMAARPSVFLRLAARNLLAPLHLLARRSWERVIPLADVGYVLTIGVTEGSPVRGGEVLQALEQEFRARGAAESWVDTERSNSRAVEFYVRHGYEIASERFGQVLLRRRLAA